MTSQRYRILQTLCPGDTTAEWQETLSREQIDRISHWFLESSCIRKWMNGSGLQVLWGFGPCGTGKTFISSQVVNHISPGPGDLHSYQAAAVYFFDHRQPQSNLADFGLPLCSIARQLAAQLPDPSTDILSQIQEGSGFYPVSDTNSERVFQKLLSTFARIFIVLDGLNASMTTIEAILNYLKGEYSHQRSVNIFITSRDPPPSSVKDSYEITTVRVQAVKEDLQRYILREAWVDHTTILRSADENNVSTTFSDLVNVTNGCFPPLPLHKNMDPAELLRTLQTVNETMSRSSPTERRNALCGLTVSKAEHVYGPPCRHVIHIVGKLFELRYPASAAMITDILQVLKLSRSDGSPYGVSDVIESCPELVIISYKYFEMRIKSPLLQNYLLEQCPQSSINRALVQASFTYLCNEEFLSGSCKSAADLKQRFRKYPFLPCAARIISVYTSKVPDPESIFDNFLQLASHPTLIESSLQAADAWPYRDEVSYTELEVSEPRWKYFPRGYAPIHLAVHLVGGRYFIDSLLRRGEDIEARTKDGLTALHIAAEVEDESDTVRTLLENGADVSAADEGGDTPLSKAVLLGSLESVKLLISYGACVETLDEDVLFECIDSRPEIAGYLAELGVKLPGKDN